MKWITVRVVLLSAMLIGSSFLGSNTQALQAGPCCYMADCQPEDNGDSCTNDIGNNCSWAGAVDYCDYTSTGCPTGASQYGSTCCYTPHSPIVIDTTNHGFSLTNPADGVFFVITQTHNQYRTAWISSNSANAWLALDRDGDGTIDNGTELFGNFTPQPDSAEPNGFSALAVFDEAANGGNHDGRIDPSDEVYSRLRLWRDDNHDGVSQPNELFTLKSMGIAGIDLSYSTSKRKDQFGNAFRFRSRVYDSPGHADGRWAWDVLLAYDENP